MSRSDPSLAMAGPLDSEGASSASESWFGGPPEVSSSARPTKMQPCVPTMPHGLTVPQLEELARASIHFLKKRQGSCSDGRITTASEGCRVCSSRSTRRSKFADLVEVFEISDRLPPSVESNSSESDCEQFGDEDELCATASLRLLRRGAKLGEARLRRLETLVSGMCVAFEDSLAQLVIDSEALETRLKKELQTSIAEITNTALYCRCNAEWSPSTAYSSFGILQEKRDECDKLDIETASSCPPSDGQLDVLHCNARALLSKAMAIARTLPSPSRQVDRSNGREEATMEAEVWTPPARVSTTCGPDSPQGPRTVSAMKHASPKASLAAPISGDGDVPLFTGKRR